MTGKLDIQNNISRVLRKTTSIVALSYAKMGIANSKNFISNQLRPTLKNIAMVCLKNQAPLY